MNNMMGVLLRFREELVCIVGDIRKISRSVKLSLLDQHTRRFLWRNMDTSIPPKTYVMNSVSFGDKPAGTIVQMVLRKTADMKRDQYPDVWQFILRSSYVVGILDSVASYEKAVELTKRIDYVLNFGGFKIKSWIVSGGYPGTNEVKEVEPQVPSDILYDSNHSVLLDDTFNTEDTNIQGHKVLGVRWDQRSDEIYFSVKLAFYTKYMKGEVVKADNSNSNCVPKD